MKKEKQIFKTLLVILLPSLLLIGCTKKLQTAETSGTFLKYNFSNGEEYKYISSSTIDQALFYGGQEIATLIETNVGFSVKNEGVNDDMIDLKVKVDYIKNTAKSMQGDMSNEPEEVRGKEFLMKLSTSGIESDLDEAEKITYISIGDQPSNLKATFSLLFSDLPTASVAIGYSWTQSDTIDLTVGDQNAQIIIHTNSVVESKEVVDGYECYKISSTNSGERSSSGNTPQGFMSSSGTLKGSGFFYFAPELGAVISEEVKQVFDGEITLPTGDSLPMSMDISINTKMVK